MDALSKEEQWGQNIHQGDDVTIFFCKSPFQISISIFLKQRNKQTSISLNSIFWKVCEHTHWYLSHDLTRCSQRVDTAADDVTVPTARMPELAPKYTAIRKCDMIWLLEHWCCVFHTTLMRAIPYFLSMFGYLTLESWSAAHIVSFFPL